MGPEPFPFGGCPCCTLEIVARCSVTYILLVCFKIHAVHTDMGFKENLALQEVRQVLIQQESFVCLFAHLRLRPRLRLSGFKMGG